MNNTIGINVRRNLNLGNTLGGWWIPTRLKFPRSLLSRTSSRSPWKILTSMAVWLLAAVENVCDFLVGVVVLWAMGLVMIPPRVSIPRERGQG